MKNDQLASRTMSGMIWKFAEKAGAQVMQMIIQIVLARLLMPDEYGLIGLLTIFISLSDVFILQGLTTALIQKKEPDQKDFSSVFYANIGLSAILYIILYVCAPAIATFYSDERLISIMRVLSLNVIIGAIPAVHNAILSRELDFKKSFYRNISNTVTQGVVGICLALSGFGAWSMVFSKISGTIVGTVVLLATVHWKPAFVFSCKSVKSLFNFSSKVLATNLLNTVFNNIHALIIGHYYSPLEVGYYQRGQQFPQTIMNSVDGSMSEVLYPAFSKKQDAVLSLKNAVRKSIRTSVYMIFPILTGLAIIAEPLTVILLTDKWLPSVPFMQLVCLNCMFWPLSHRSHALNAIGRSDITLKLSLIGKGITLLFLIIGIPFGIYAMVLSGTLSSFISFWISSYYSRKIIMYTYKELFYDLFPSLALSAIMGLSVYSISLFSLPTVFLLVCQVIVGAVIYIGLSTLLKVKPFMMLLGIIRKTLKKEKTL